MFNKIKKIKDMRSQAKEMQSKMAEITAEGSASWGKVKVQIDGNQKVLGVEIDDKLMDDKEKLQDALKDAFNDANKKIQKEMMGKMKEMGSLQDMMKNMGL